MNLGKRNISSLFSSSFSSSVHNSCLSILSCLYFSVHRIPPPPSPHHINFFPKFLLACTVVMFSSSFPPPSRNQLICHIDRSWGCHQLCRILFILLSIYRKSRKIRYFGCRSKDSSSSSSSSSHDSSTSLLLILDFSLPTDSFLERTLSGFFVFIQGLMTHLKIN